jgi:hypothetical protein
MRQLVKRSPVGWKPASGDGKPALRAWCAEPSDCIRRRRAKAEGALGAWLEAACRFGRASLPSVGNRRLGMVSPRCGLGGRSRRIDPTATGEVGGGVGGPASIAPDFGLLFTTLSHMFSLTLSINRSMM